MSVIAEENVSMNESRARSWSQQDSPNNTKKISNARKTSRWKDGRFGQEETYKEVQPMEDMFYRCKYSVFPH
jgi:hypothetical protein